MKRSTTRRPFSPTSQGLLGIISLASALACLASSTGCGDTAASTAYTPQTGVIVRSEALTTGIGCGTGATQIFKYVAVAVDADNHAAAAGTFECFADGVLVNLQPAASTASLDYTVKVYAFNQTAFTAVQAQITSAVATPNTSGGVFAAPAFATLGPTYTTSCTASEQANIQVVAVCAKLAATSAVK